MVKVLFPDKQLFELSWHDDFNEEDGFIKSCVVINYFLNLYLVQYELELPELRFMLSSVTV